LSNRRSMENKVIFDLMASLVILNRNWSFT
jgi:hypothetical protein